MAMQKRVPIDFEEYVALFPAEVGKLLKQMRRAIRQAAPGAHEKISYGMPGFSLEGPLVYFAAFKRHIGFYPTPSGIAAFKKELAGYKWAKGSVQFPLNQALPLALVSRIVKFRARENLARRKTKKPK